MFLGGALGAAGGLVVAGSMADVAWAASSAPDPKTFFPLVLSSDLAASPQPQRFVFALSHSTAKGIQYASGPAVTVRFRKQGGQWAQPQKPAFDRAGLPKGRGVYVAATGARQRRHLAGRGACAGSEDPVHDRGGRRRPPRSSPARPRRAIPHRPRPTPSASTPICTRDPQCPLHTAVAVDGDRRGQAGRRAVRDAGAVPVAVLRAGARRVPDTIKPVRRPDRRSCTSRSTRTHRHRARRRRSTAWRLPSEPWLFGIDGAGTVQSRDRRRVRRHGDEGPARRARAVQVAGPRRVSAPLCVTLTR